MSSTIIVAAIIILLITLTCYALISQNLEKKRKQKQRILSALRSRSKSFKHILSGFPPDFLTKDLQVLVSRCLIDVTEQLARLEPKDNQHIEELKLFSQQLESIKNQPNTGKRKPLQNPQQVKEVKHHLEELNSFITQMINRGNFSATQGTLYQQQIQRLVLQMTVDSYLVNAKQSQKSNKTRLAIHYYTLAAKLLTKENTNKDFDKQIGQLRQLITTLDQQLAEEEPEQHKANARSNATKEAADKEWENITDEKDELWKKKNVYD